MTSSSLDTRARPADRPGVSRWHRLASYAALASLLLTGCSEGSDIAPQEQEEAPGARHASTWDELLQQANQELQGRDALSQARLADGLLAPRMHRILRTDEPMAFTATGPALAPADPRTVALSAGYGAQERDGTFRLAPGSQLVSAEELGLPAGEISELLLRVRVASGSALEVVFQIRHSKEIASVSIPVQSGGSWQTLRVSQPLLMHNDLDNVVDRIRLVSPKDLDETLVLQIEPLIIARPGAVYSLATHGAREELLGDSLRSASWQSANGELRLPWPAQAEGRQLLGSFALRRLPVPGGAAGPQGAGDPALSVQVETADGRALVLAEESLRADERWRELRLELPVGVDADALVLTTSGMTPGDVALHADWRVIDDSRPPRRAVLLIMDTLRADALGCYGRDGDPTPGLDSLADEGVLFTRCYSQAHWTRPSMPSIMTGLYTPETGVHGKTDQLPTAYDTLAERFAAAGWRTAAFIANAQAGPASGLGQGWDELVLCLGDDSDAQFREVVEPRLARLPDDDLLLYVHLMEPHGPYGPPERPEGHVEPDGQPVEFSTKYDRAWMTSPTLESRVSWYDQDVRSMDRAIVGFLERVVGAWEREGGPVLVAALSDHGEWLGEEGLWGHGKGLLRPEVVHTPLILRAPGQLTAGRVWDEPVENLDVGATLLELAGAPLAADGADHGRSLLARLDQGGSASFALSSNGDGKQTQFTFWTPEGGSFLESRQLAEVLEGDRISPAGDPAREASLAALEQLFGQSALELKRAHWLDTSGSAQELDAESLQQLRALGYLGY
jgi:arylsulfatase A-like enzyme